MLAGIVIADRAKALEEEHAAAKLATLHGAGFAASFGGGAAPHNMDYPPKR